MLQGFAGTAASRRPVSGKLGGLLKTREPEARVQRLLISASAVTAGFCTTSYRVPDGWLAGGSKTMAASFRWGNFPALARRLKETMPRRTLHP